MAQATMDALAASTVRAPAPGKTARGARRRRKASEFWLYFAVTFPIFLVVALLARLLPRDRRPFSGGPRSGVIGDAKAAAYTVLPFVFMG